MVAGLVAGAVGASCCSSSSVINPSVSASLSLIGSMKSVSATTALAPSRLMLCASTLPRWW